MERRNKGPSPARTATAAGSANAVGVFGIVACWVALVATMACNFLFEFLRLGGVTASEVSNQVFAWFTPAGYVFSIWTLIYAALVVWLIAETPRVRGGRSMGARQAVLFVLSCALNIGWLVAFHYQQIALALVVLAALWLDMALLYVSMRDDGSRTRYNLIPFSLYFGWLTVALIANATNLATRMVDATLLANQISTVVLVVAVLVVAYLSVRNSRDYVFPLVIAWATVGVSARLAEVDATVSGIVMLATMAAVLAMYIPLAFTASKSSARRLRAGGD